jgi:hypothetical protein
VEAGPVNDVAEQQRLERARKVCESCHLDHSTQEYDLHIFHRPVRLCAECRDAAEVFL